MNTTATKPGRTGFRKIDRKEPEWLYNIRKESWVAYNDQAIPTRVAHLWRYTNPLHFAVNPTHDIMQLLPPLPDRTETDTSLLKPDHAAFGYNRGDAMTFAMANPELAASGLVFKNLYSAVREDDNLVGDYLGHLIGNTFGKFEALNLAFWSTGLFLYIPDNMIVEKPIRLQRQPTGPVTFHRLLIITGENTDVTVIDDYSGECRREDALINSVVEIYTGSSSRTQYAGIQRQAGNCKTYITQRARVARDACISSVFAALGSTISKVNAGSVLTGEGANGRLYGLIFGNDSQHFDYHTMHHHQAGASYSNIDVKVALKDNAASAYTGLIKINEDALNCEAFQENRNLLLDGGTKAESIPELEILCDKVRCSHGATMGRIDPEMLFYLKSRGLSHSEAVKTIISGFIGPTIDQLPDDLRQLMRNLALSKLKGN
ncbi:MAG: SufD family Fe-S cluster assembly protein [Candidatus Zixiibacteriota bacterium]|nr:MAG: SufD family Fe-S cluster assembly protein [candidate division Zixibacteria bacterium]